MCSIPVVFKISSKDLPMPSEQELKQRIKKVYEEKRRLADLEAFNIFKYLQLNGLLFTELQMFCTAVILSCVVVTLG